MSETVRRPADAPESVASSAPTLGSSLPSAVPPPTPPVLPVIPGYEVLEELGRGGMGVVYKARHLKLQRIVALKMILAGEFAGPEEVVRLRQEAEALGRLQHPNIVQIFEVGEVSGRPFCALEYVEGGALDRKLAGAPQPTREAAALVETLARAVHAAHQRRIVHRDLKPQNILLTADGTPKITDFGLAKRLDEEGRTVSGAVLGTPSYMAPEQARGKGKEVGPAADVYALGAVLFQLLTGRPPFKAETPLDTVLQVLTIDPPPPRQLRPDVQRDLETICLTCLNKDPRRRYATAGALADDLRRFLDRRPILVRRVGAVEKLGLWAQRRPASAAAVGFLALAAALGVGGGAAVWSWLRAEEARGQAVVQKNAADKARTEAEGAKQKADAARDEADQQREQAETARGDAVQAQQAEKKAREDLAKVSYLRQVDLAYRDWLGLRFAHADKLLDECPPESRQWEWRYVKRLCHPELLAFGIKDDVRGLAYSRDGQSIAGGVWGGSPKLWDPATGREVRQLDALGGAGNAVAFCRDGRLRGASETGLFVWDVPHGDSEGRKTSLDLAFGTEPMLSADGSRLVGIWQDPAAGADAERKAKVWDAEFGQEIAVLQGDFRFNGALVLSADGALAAGGSTDVQLWDAATGRRLRTFEGSARADCAVFSADGKLLAAGDHHQVVVWDVATGHRVHTLEGHGSDVTRVAFSPDGKRLASASYYDGTVRLWDLETNRELRTLGGHERVEALAFRPDGKQLVSAGRDGLKLWDASADQDESRRLNGQWAFAERPDEISAVAFGPGDRLFSASSDGSVERWDTAARRPAGAWRAPEIGGDRLCGLAVRADGEVAAACSENTIWLWAPATGRLLRTLDRGEAFDVQSVAFRSDGKRLVSAGHIAVQVWDVDDGMRVSVFKADTDKEKTAFPAPAGAGATELSDDFMSAAFSPDGRRLAAGSYGGVRVWDAESGNLLQILWGDAPGAPTHIAWSADGRWIAGADGWVVRVWESETGKEVYTLSGHNSFVESVAFSPDGRRLASASEDQSVELWDLETGQEVLTLHGHAGTVRAVAFSPDGGLLASGGDDKTVRLWDGRALENAP